MCLPEANDVDASGNSTDFGALKIPYLCCSAISANIFESCQLRIILRGWLINFKRIVRFFPRRSSLCNWHFCHLAYEGMSTCRSVRERSNVFVRLETKLFVLLATVVSSFCFSSHFPDEIVLLACSLHDAHHCFSELFSSPRSWLKWFIVVTPIVYFKSLSGSFWAYLYDNWTSKLILTLTLSRLSG